MLFVGWKVKLRLQVLVHELPQPFRTAAQLLFNATFVVLLQVGVHVQKPLTHTSPAVALHTLYEFVDAAHVPPQPVSAFRPPHAKPLATVVFPVQVVWQHVLVVGLQVKPAVQVLLHVPPQPSWTAAQELPAVTFVVLLQDGVHAQTPLTHASPAVVLHALYEFVDAAHIPPQPSAFRPRIYTGC